MKLLVCDKIADSAVEALQAIPNVDCTVKVGMAPEELLTVIPEYEGMIIRSATKVTTEVLQAASNLKVVIRGGIGLDNVDRETAKKNGVDVRNTPTATTNSVAELTIGMMYALARHIGYAHASMRAGKWEKKNLKGIELAGKTLGLIGTGRIGKRVAELAKAIGMIKVIGYDPYVDADTLAKAGIEKKELDAVLQEADWISLHLPKTDETANMLSTEQFKKMKNDARIVNAARGGVIDENAITQALNEGTIGGYAVDVYSKEPAESNNPLFTVNNNILFTPHIGASTQEGQDRVGEEIVNIVKEYV